MPSTRTLTLQNTLANVDLTPQVGAPVSAALLTPTQLAGIDLDSVTIFDGAISQVGTVTDSVGHYSLTVAYPGDISPAGCALVVNENGVITVSPAFSYVSTVAVSSWYPVGSLSGTLKMIDTLGRLDTTALQGSPVSIVLASKATAPTGVVMPGGQGVSLNTDSGGRYAVYAYPTASCTPSNIPLIATYVDGSSDTFTVPLTPTGYQGAYAGGTTYHANAGTKVSPADVVSEAGVYYQYINATPAAGHDPATSPTYWQVFPGEPIAWNITASSPPGITTFDQTSLAADAAVLTGPFGSTTLQDELRQRFQADIRNTGAWSGVTAYLLNDATQVSGVWYVCNTPHTGHTPPNVGFWSPLASGAGTGTVTSVALTVPADLAVAGSPITAGGTLAITRTAQSGRKVLASPADGSSAAPAYRAITPADVPVMGAAGGSHAAGLAPDPGAVVDLTKFLRSDATYAVPAGGGGGGSSALVPLHETPYTDENPAAGTIITPTALESATEATGNFQAYPAVCVTQSRRIVMFWNDTTGDGDAAGRLTYHYSDDGHMPTGARIYPTATPAAGRYKAPGSVVCTQRGRVIASYVNGLAGDPTGDQAWYITSDDNVVTWSSETQFSGGFTAWNFPAGQGIVTRDGYILLPVYGQDTGDPADNAHNRCGLFRSVDNGNTFTFVRISTSGTTNLNETGFVELPDGSLRAYIRQDTGTSSMHPYVSASTDGGTTWSTPTPISGLTFYPGMITPCRAPHSNQLFLFFRSQTGPEHAHYIYSNDLGVTWSAEVVYSATAYSYAAMAAYDRNTIVGAVGLQSSSSISNLSFFRFHVGTTPQPAAAGGVAISHNGAAVASEAGLNFLDGGGVTFTTTDNPGSSRVDVSAVASGGGGGGAYAPMVMSNPGGTAPIFVVDTTGQLIMVEIS